MSVSSRKRHFIRSDFPFRIAALDSFIFWPEHFGAFNFNVTARNPITDPKMSNANRNCQYILCWYVVETHKFVSTEPWHTQTSSGFRKSFAILSRYFHKNEFHFSDKNLLFFNKFYAERNTLYKRTVQPKLNAQCDATRYDGLFNVFWTFCNVTSSNLFFDWSDAVAVRLSLVITTNKIGYFFMFSCTAKMGEKKKKKAIGEEWVATLEIKARQPQPRNGNFWMHHLTWPDFTINTMWRCASQSCWEQHAIGSA